MDADVRNMDIGDSTMQTSEAVGGSGGGSSQPQPTTRDVRLLERAIRESWDLSEDIRQAMLARLGTLISDPTTKTRAFLAAAKTLIGLSRLNLVAIDVAIRARQQEDLDERLTELERWKNQQAMGLQDQRPHVVYETPSGEDLP